MSLKYKIVRNLIVYFKEGGLNAVFVLYDACLSTMTSSRIDDVTQSVRPFVPVFICHEI